MKPMLYSDLLQFSSEQIVDERILVWSEHYETAVFHLTDEIHPETKWIWYQLFPNSNKPTIIKVLYLPKPLKGLLTSARKPVHYQILEDCFGRVPFKNEVVFTKYPKHLHTASAAGNTAEAVFPQNMYIDKQINHYFDAQRYNKVSKRPLLGKPIRGSKVNV